MTPEQKHDLEAAVSDYLELRDEVLGTPEADAAERAQSAKGIVGLMIARNCQAPIATTHPSTAIPNNSANKPCPPCAKFVSHHAACSCHVLQTDAGSCNFWPSIFFNHYAQSP